MGHNHEECGDGLWEEKDKQYGTWMLAQRKDVQYAASGPTMGARPFMRGRGEEVLVQGEGAVMLLLLPKDRQATLI